MKNTANKYERYLKKFIGKKILVIGDLILDRYLQGSCSRIAPEATVPVIDLNSSRACLGGAANVAANLSALGASVQLCSVIGIDTSGHCLTNLLNKHGINTDLTIHDQERSTICKTRVSSGSQLIVRYDEGSCDLISPTTAEQLKQNIIASFNQVDAVFISDYGKGVLTDSLISTLISLRKNSTQIIAVDARDFALYAAMEPTLIKPNYSEALSLCQFKAAHDKRPEQVKNWGETLYRHSGAKHIFLSMDKDGVCCFKEGNFYLHQPAPTVPNPQVSGAGDTFIATALMALLSGADINSTTELAVSAAALVISEPHTAVCDIEHLKKNLGEKQKLLLGKQEIKQLIADYKAQGKRIVFTNGCFDILHSGHVSYLKGSKAQGDVLIVGLNTDESIKRLKGLQRPINSLDDRTEVLSELSCIDHIIPFGESGDDTPISLLQLIKPHFFVKGGDYRHKFLPEKKLLDSIGCKIVFLPTVANRSTSNVISKIQENLSFAGQNIVN
jgi:D-beta-D-heptose 7-phosphate kinase/D-beta-D-heptose 1-phosphate adenosyltransferase